MESEEVALVYVLEEPSIDDDFDSWAAWYERMKGCRDELQAFMEPRFVPVLATATKGAGRDGRDEPSGSILEDCMTLHGQTGGGL